MEEYSSFISVSFEIKLSNPFNNDNYVICVELYNPDMPKFFLKGLEKDTFNTLPDAWKC